MEDNHSRVKSGKITDYICTNRIEGKECNAYTEYESTIINLLFFWLAADSINRTCISVKPWTWVLNEASREKEHRYPYQSSNQVSREKLINTAFRQLQLSPTHASSANFCKYPLQVSSANILCKSPMTSVRYMIQNFNHVQSPESKVQTPDTLPVYYINLTKSWSKCGVPLSFFDYSPYMQLSIFLWHWHSHRHSHRHRRRNNRNRNRNRRLAAAQAQLEGSSARTCGICATHTYVGQDDSSHFDYPWIPEFLTSYFHRQ